MNPTSEIAEELAAGRAGRLYRLFAEEGIPPPRVVWDPQPDDLPVPLPRLLAHWTALCGDADLPSPRAIDPTDLRFILGSLMLVDVGESDPAATSAPTFTYRLYGTRIAASYGRDMTGRATTDFDGRMGVFFTATYEAVRRRRRPLYTEHMPLAMSGVTLWRRLLLPLADADGAVVRFLVGNLAQSDKPCSPMMPRGDGCSGPGG